MKKVKRILAAVTAAALALLIAPELGGEVFSQFGEIVQGFAVSVSAEEGETGAAEMDTKSDVTEDTIADNDSIAVLADDIIASGYCGDRNENYGKNVTWLLDRAGVLTISGTGKMSDRIIYDDDTSWYLYRKSITMVIINNNVTSIGNNAFYQCESLTSITIPNSVSEIGSGAFSYCTRLASITIPSSVSEIGSSAFSGCSNLASMTIPSSVSEIGSSAFSGCSNLASVTIPNSVTEIGMFAFNDCRKLINITIPDSVTYMGGGVFEDCTSLKSITISNNITEIKEDGFRGCTSLLSIKIPDSVTSIGRWAFEGCTNLTSITISDSVVSIEFSAFYYCTKLKHIHIPVDKTYSDYAGQGSLPTEPSYYFPGGCGDPDCPLGGGNGTDISNKNGKCGDNAYWKLDSGDGYNEDPGYGCVLTISGSGDMYDYSLDSSNYAPWHNYKDQIKFIIIENGITGIGTSAFTGCDSVSNIYFPSSVKKISANALLNCTALKSCIIENYKIDMSSSMLGYFSASTDTNNKQLVNGLTLYSHDNSNASKYADSNNIPFEKIYFPNEFVSFKGTVVEKKGSGLDSGLDYLIYYFLELENDINYYNEFSNLIVLGKTCEPIITTNVVAISVNPNISMLDYVDKTVIAIGDMFTSSDNCIWNTQYGFDPSIGQCMIADGSQTYTVKWYNGETLLDTEEYTEKEYPKFKGTTPKCHDDEYGLSREFLGWTTKNNIDYDIHIPENLSIITRDTTFYAVFSDKEPEVDISDEEADKVKYINEHMDSAKRKEWNVDGVKYANDFRFDLQNGATETAHYIWRTVQMTDKSVNLDILGIIEEVRANDYNAIMLDMFNSIEGYESESTFFNEAENKALKDFENIVMGWGKYAFSSEIKYQTELRKELNQFDSDRDVERLMKAVDDLCEKTGLSNVNYIIPKEYVDLYNLSDKVFTKVNLSLETVQDVIKNSDKIAAYRMYQYMSNEYKDILVEMYYCADSISNSDWEVKHLKEAIAYALNYYYNTEEQAANEFMKNIIFKNVYNLGMKKTVQDFFKNGSEKFIDKALASDTTAGSAKLNGSLIIAAVQNGFKFGVKISDLLFESSNREDIYVKVKEFGVLSETLQKALDERASELFSATTIDDQYAAAKRFDKAFKMFMYVEAAASDNIAEYENTFEKNLAVKASNGVVDAINFFIKDNKLDKLAAQHVENAAVFTDHAKFMRRLFCHNDDEIVSDKIAILSEYGGKLKEHKIIIVSCPVRMNVYNEDKILVGSLSAGNSNVTKGYENYIYRIEETDSCVACVPMNYTVEIIGLDDGTMKVIGSYYDGNNQESTFSYNNVQINSEYRSNVTVNKEILELVAIGSDLPSNPTPSIPSGGNDGNQGSTQTESPVIAPSNTAVSTTFTIKVENRITGKNRKTKATRQNEDITLKVGKENNGYFANAYTFDGKVFGSVKIKNGKVKFTIPTDINFYIVIDKNSHLEYEDVSSGAGVYEIFEEKKEPFCMLIIVIAALGFLSASIASRCQKNKH